MMRPPPAKQVVLDVQGSITVTINGVTHEATIIEAWAAQDERTDLWSAAAKVDAGQVWALQGKGPIDAIAKCLAVAVAGPELGE